MLGCWQKEKGMRLTQCYIVRSLEKEDCPENLHVLFCFVQLKSVLFNLFCVLDLCSRTLAVNSVSDFFCKISGTKENIWAWNSAQSGIHCWVHKTMSDGRAPNASICMLKDVLWHTNVLPQWPIKPMSSQSTVTSQRCHCRRATYISTAFHVPLDTTLCLVLKVSWSNFQVETNTTSEIIENYITPKSFINPV